MLVAAWPAFTADISRTVVMGLLPGPLLPLGPLVHANHRVHDRALQHFGLSGGWDAFVAVMLALTRKAAAFTARTLSEGQSLP